MSYDYDILIVGAGTAGTYLAARLAERDHRVAVIERSPLDKTGARLDIFHIDSIRFEEFGLDEPEVGSDICLARHEFGRAWSPNGKYSKKVDYGFHVMRFGPFLNYLHDYAKKRGAVFIDECEFREVIFENGSIVGVRAERKGKKEMFRARLTVDSTGTASAVRKSLPASLNVETFAVGPEDVLYVILRYISWTNSEEVHPEGLNFWPYYKVFCNPGLSEEEAILGVGQPKSYDNAENWLIDYLGRIPFPEYRTAKIEKGVTPFRRTPFSIVGCGFLCLGDSACMTKPFSGEGVTASWTACSIAADVTDRALICEEGALSAESLWKINTEYFKGQGAKFAGLMAQIPGAAYIKPQDMDYLFERDIIFSGPEITEINKNYELRLSQRRILKIISELLRGTFNGKFSYRSMISLAKSIIASGRIVNHYEAFPEKPKDFSDWQRKAEKLWRKAGY